MGNVVFFRGTSPGSSSDLWVSDGTAAGTFAVGGAKNAGVAGTVGGLAPFTITPFGGGVLFASHNSNRFGLWFSDGTAAGTHEIAGAQNSSVAGISSGGLDPTDITVFGNKALFFAEDSDSIDGLWVTDGTTSGTFELGGLKNSGISGQLFSGLAPTDLTPAGNEVFFIGSDTDNNRSLWVTNGTVSGTVEVGGLNNAGISAGPSGVPFDAAVLDESVSVGDDIIFGVGNSLWVSDGTAGGTVDIAPNLFRPNDLTVFGTKVLFEGGLAVTDNSLWITDGTAAGTTEIGGPEHVGIIGADTELWIPNHITVFGDKALFTASDSGGGDDALWVTDGTAGGTTEIGGLKNAGISGKGKLGLVPGNLVSIGTKVLFLGEDPSGVNALWVSDGTAAGTFELGGTNNVGVAGAPAAGLDPASITASGGKGYFISPDFTGTERLWESDGTVAGTHVVAAGPTGFVTAPLDLTAGTLGGSLTPPPPPTGNNDILLQNVSGQAAIWDVSGATLTSSALLGANPGPNWKDVGTGDFNDDTLPDILLQNTNGAVAIWETNGTRLTSSALVANPGANWKAVGTGDFNGDHHSDILLQNTNGSRCDLGHDRDQSDEQRRRGQSWTKLEGGRNRRLQPRRPFRHSVAEHQRQRCDLGDERGERDKRDEQRCRRRSRAELEGGRNRRLQPRRPIRHSVAEYERQRCDLGDERDRSDEQRRRGQSRRELACDRDERRFRHPPPEHKRPNRALGHERNQLDRQRRRERQRRAKLASGRARLAVTLKPAT